MMNVAYAMGQGPAGGAGSPSPLVSFVPILLMFFIFYVLLIRPQQRRQREHSRMVSQLKKNDAVVTNGGIHGVVVNVKENSVVLKVDDNVKIEVQKSAITHLKKP